MTSKASIEILDLRHFAASVLRPVLEAEGELWKQRLHWDYRTSTRLLMQYLDSHMLPGYAALESGQVTGYVFCVYEETKGVIGDVFALSPPAEFTAAWSLDDFRAAPTDDSGENLESAQPVQVSALADQPSAHEIEEILLKHLF